MESRYFLTGERIFSEGDEGDKAYIIKRGRVKILKQAHGGDREIAQIGPGNIIGEMALIDDSPRAASAIALDEGEAMVLTKGEFERRLERSDKVVALLLKTYTDRLRQQIG